MNTLRLTQSDAGSDRYRVEIAWEGDGPRQTATAEFGFQMTDQDRRDLQWYLEDYLQHPHEPAPTIAQRIERRMEQIGCELFGKLFEGDGKPNPDAARLWARLSDRLADLRIEIVTTVQEASAIPWELLRDPHTGEPLAVAVREFVRAHPNPVRPAAQAPGSRDGSPIRVLLVICRPGLEVDVPFRSVAGRLVKCLTEETRAVYQLDVLRPPTVERLGEVLQQAHADGTPYHVVHFDGHGAFLDLARLIQQWEREKKADDEILKLLAEIVDFDPARFSPKSLYPHQPEPGEHGYLVFENPGHTSNHRLVDGRELGHLLAANGVSVLLMNACRSAHAEPDDTPPTAVQPGDDPHAQVRAFGSLAQQAMDQGLCGVLAMRYNVYVVTAAQFVADLYAELVRGRTLGQAATLGRKRLQANPLRTIAYDPVRLEDWGVPIIYEAEPIRLFPEGRQQAGPKLTVAIGQSAAEPGALDPGLPKPPDVGFFGRDETLLALDRAFDRHRVVLLHAYAGSGKTAAAAEFARWYAATGGLQGPVLFTSFEQHQPLARVLDRIGQTFGPRLEQAGVHWLAMDDAARRDVALQVLKQVPVLWIWDNVEPVAGFPAGTKSPWSEAEQRELADFLRDCQQTQARFLLTSRRDERAWLGDLPRRIAVRPMPMQERVQLARALAERHGRAISAVDDWRPLLRFTEGNPLTITVLVGQALRDRRQTPAQIDDFVEQLRRGEARFDDDQAEGRTRSLGASLAYGFEHAFTEPQRCQLALLHFFQGFVQVDTLRSMGDPEAPWCLPEVRGLTEAAGIALLDRAAEIGLLTALGNGCYRIHPALPWFFKNLFDAHYPPGSRHSPSAVRLDTQDPPPPSMLASGESTSFSPPTEPDPQQSAMRAFVEAMGELGNYYHEEYGAGNRGGVGMLEAEEANLLHARQLARQQRRWPRVISVMQGLDTLHEATGRRLEWRRLVEEIVPDFIDPATEGPLPDREDDWSMVTEYRVRLAAEDLDWPQAERLQNGCVDWNRREAEAVVARLEAEEGRPSEGNVPAALASRVRSLGRQPAGNDRNTIRSLAASLHELAEIQRDSGWAECVASYTESLGLTKAIDDRPATATVAFNLGGAYKYLPAIRDLALAERRYRESLDILSQSDNQGRAKCHMQIGSVAIERFYEAKVAGRAEKELFQHLNDALRAYQQALAMLPKHAVDDLAVAHNNLGEVYGRAGDLDHALPHYREAIRYREAQGNRYGAGRARYNVAILLAQHGRLPDARLYAEAALRDFESYGTRAADMVQLARQLLAEIDQSLNSP
jgi:tetratricopeptide (TPR) repeat protein